MLSDRYYIGYVTFDGEEFPGSHPRLVDPDLFERVQAVLHERSGSGTRQRRYHHYLKGTLWCGKCHDQGRLSRMIIQRAVGRGGEYFYFFCRGRQERACDTRYIDVALVEEAVARHYGTLRFAPEFIADVRRIVAETVADEGAAVGLLREQLAKELARLDRQEENLLDLVADGDVGSTKVSDRIKSIQQQRHPSMSSYNVRILGLPPVRPSWKLPWTSSKIPRISIGWPEPKRVSR